MQNHSAKYLAANLDHCVFGLFESCIIEMIHKLFLKSLLFNLSFIAFRLCLLGIKDPIIEGPVQIFLTSNQTQAIFSRISVITDIAQEPLTSLV